MKMLYSVQLIIMTWTKVRMQTSVKLVICASLILATHCQQSLNQQAEHSESNQNTHRDDSLKQEAENSEPMERSHTHVTGSRSQPVSVQAGHTVPTTGQQNHYPPSTENQIQNSHSQHHFQTDGRQVEQQAVPDNHFSDKPSHTEPISRQQDGFQHQNFEKEINQHSHHQRHQGESNDIYAHQHHPHDPNLEDQLPHDSPQTHSTDVYKHHPRDHTLEDQLPRDSAQTHTANIHQEDLATPEQRQKIEQDAQQQPEDQGSQEYGQTSWPRDDLPPAQGQGSQDTGQMSWSHDRPAQNQRSQESGQVSRFPNDLPQTQEELAAVQQQQQISPIQEPPHHQSNSDHQQVVPPLLAEDEADFQRGDEIEEKKTKEEEKEPETELTPEEKAAEELFLAGEQLINATYYKEYHEAYLNFLEAAQLNHQRAKEYVAFGYLFGDYLPQNVTKAAQLFEELASKGSPKAQMGLAFMYSAGFFYNSSQAKALIYSTFGALGGEPLAQMALGYRYYAGIGVESTCETALTYYRKVATKVADSVTLAGGPVVQRISLQDEAENAGTNNSPMLDDDLLQYYHFLADKGDQQAQVVLGTLYYQGGKGVQINHEQAYHYFSTAAESGNGHALGYLGKMHSEGSPFIRQNNQTAFEYFKKSSEKNNHIGQAGLGMMYLNGLGVDKDVSKAFRYFSLASDQGSVDGQLQLGIMYFSGNGVRTDYKLAVKYFTMASQKGHVLAFYNLAQMHATGTGVLRNCHTAVELFKNVAERGKWSEMLMDAHRMYHEGNVDTALVKYMFLADLGYEVAQSNVAYLLDSGATLKFTKHETYQRALLQYSRAASQGSTLARLKMGDYYYYGLGTEVDYESAASHYRMASEQQNNAQAMFNLGYMHERGLGLKQDVHLAKRFYDMAAETSMDAHVPVTMALMKLGLLYGVDVFSKEFEGLSGLLSLLDPMAVLGPQWDLILASALASVLSVIYILRRMR